MAKPGKLTKAHLTEVMNGIVQEVAIPLLNDKGFKPSPFLEDWYGKNNLKNYVYFLFRINDRFELEYLHIQWCPGKFDQAC